MAHSYFFDAVREQVFLYMFRYPPGIPVPILVSESGDHIGVIGAAMMVRQRLVVEDFRLLIQTSKRSLTVRRFTSADFVQPQHRAAALQWYIKDSGI